MCTATSMGIEAVGAEEVVEGLFVSGAIENGVVPAVWKCREKSDDWMYGY